MRSVLIIDDVEIIRDSVSDILSLSGYNTYRAENGHLGIQLAREKEPDLIICDIDMPEMNGYEVLKVIKADENLSLIPFIFLTAKTQKFELREGMDLGADDYITKPFDHVDLLNSVEARFKKQTIIKSDINRKLSDVKLKLATTLPHEFKTPLNGIIGPSQLLMEDLEDFEPAEIKEFISMIFNSSQRLNKLVDNFLYYNELEMKFLVDEHASDNLILNNCDTQFRDSIESLPGYEKRKDDISIETNPCSLKISEEHFSKLIYELGTNCIKFSHEGNKIHFKLIVENENAVLGFYNEGIGLSEQQIQEVGAYNQFDRKIYEQQGIGLGLIISKRICQFNNFDFEISGNIDEFAQIKITIPIA